MKVYSEISSGFLLSIIHEKNPKEMIEALLREAGLSLRECNQMRVNQTDSYWGFK